MVKQGCSYGVLSKGARWLGFIMLLQAFCWAPLRTFSLSEGIAIASAITWFAGSPYQSDLREEVDKLHEELESVEAESNVPEIERLTKKLKLVRRKYLAARMIRYLAVAGFFGSLIRGYYSGQGYSASGDIEYEAGDVTKKLAYKDTYGIPDKLPLATANDVVGYTHMLLSQKPTQGGFDVIEAMRKKGKPPVTVIESIIARIRLVGPEVLPWLIKENLEGRSAVLGLINKLIVQLQNAEKNLTHYFLEQIEYPGDIVPEGDEVIKSVGDSVNLCSHLFYIKSLLFDLIGKNQLPDERYSALERRGMILYLITELARERADALLWYKKINQEVDEICSDYNRMPLGGWANYQGILKKQEITSDGYYRMLVALQSHLIYEPISNYLPEMPLVTMAVTLHPIDDLIGSLQQAVQAVNILAAKNQDSALYTCEYTYLSGLQDLQVPKESTNDEKREIKALNDLKKKLVNALRDARNRLAKHAQGNTIDLNEYKQTVLTLNQLLEDNVFTQKHGLRASYKERVYEKVRNTIGVKVAGLKRLRALIKEEVLQEKPDKPLLRKTPSKSSKPDNNRLT